MATKTKVTPAKPSFQQLKKRSAPVFDLSQGAVKEDSGASSKLGVDLDSLADEVSLLESWYADLALQLIPVLDPNDPDEDTKSAACAAPMIASPVQEKVRNVTRRVQLLRHSIANLKSALVV